MLAPVAGRAVAPIELRGEGVRRLRRVLRAAHGVFIEACRTLARFVPPLLLHALLLPYELIRGASLARRERRLPLRSLSPRPTDKLPGYFTRWRYQSRNYERWLATLWPELWKRPPWSSRYRVDNGETILRLLADRPVVLTTLHTGWQFAAATWLLHRGIEIGSVVAIADQWARAVELRNSDYWARYEGTHIFLRGDTRAMVRFLTPGRAFLVQVDYDKGKVVDLDWHGTRWQLSSGAFRLARLANAAVVPLVALDDGLWRYRIRVGTPVPDTLIAAGDDAASAAHVFNELMPLMADVPDQLMGWMPVAMADSGLGDQTA
jgi:hypothetical protein